MPLQVSGLLEALVHDERLLYCLHGVKLLLLSIDREAVPHQEDLGEGPSADDRVDHPVFVVHIFRPLLIVVLLGTTALLVLGLKELLQTHALVVEGPIHLFIHKRGLVSDHGVEGFSKVNISGSSKAYRIESNSVLLVCASTVRDRLNRLMGALIVSRDLRKTISC